MKRLLALAMAMAAITMMAETSASAQGYNGGYELGAGLNAAGYPGFGYPGIGYPGYGHGQRYRHGVVGLNQFRDTALSREFRREKPPFFATFPPVYYSHAVKRPYGVSPYAAPPGIIPVEMMGSAPAPVSVSNPFFKKEAVPAKAPAKPKVAPNQKVTWFANPYIANVAGR